MTNRAVIDGPEGILWRGEGPPPRRVSGHPVGRRFSLFHIPNCQARWWSHSRLHPPGMVRQKRSIAMKSITLNQIPGVRREGIAAMSDAGAKRRVLSSVVFLEFLRADLAMSKRPMRATRAPEKRPMPKSLKRGPGAWKMSMTRSNTPYHNMKWPRSLPCPWVPPRPTARRMNMMMRFLNAS